MENGHQRKLVIGLLAFFAGFSAPAFSNEDLSIDDLGLTPEVTRRDAKLAGIDSENFELGISGGMLSVEDFESNALVTANLTYHISEDFFVEMRIGQSQLGTSSFDRLSGAATLIPSDDNDVTLYDLSIGANLFPGEAFLLDRWAMNSSFYAIAGVGATQFVGDNHFTINAGMGYRLIANDFISLQFQVRDHIFDTEITGAAKTTHNLEISAGLSFFF